MKPRVLIFKNYLAEEKCNYLNQWMLEQINSKKIGVGITTKNGEKYSDTPERVPSKNRYTSRMYSENYVYPKMVYEIFENIKKEFNLINATVSTNGGIDGVVVSCCFDGGDVYLHKDRKEGATVSLLRCNILTSNAESGGLIHVQNKTFSLSKGDMMCYLVDEYEHMVEPVEGKTPRIMWMFGMLVTKFLWETGKICPNHLNAYNQQ